MKTITDRNIFKNDVTVEKLHVITNAILSVNAR